MTVRSVAVRDRVEPLEPYIQTIDETRLSRREVLALRVAGALADAPYRLTDELFSQVRTEFNDAEIVEMMFACAVFSWGNIVGIGMHLDTAPDSPYGGGLDYAFGKRQKAAKMRQRRDVENEETEVGPARASIEHYCPPMVYNPASYSQGVSVTGAQTLIFLAGQVAYDAHGGVAGKGDFQMQARAVFSNIKAMVEAKGGSLANVVKLNTYVTDMANRTALVSIWKEFFGTKLPPGTLITTPALANPDWLIEVDGIAVI